MTPETLYTAALGSAIAVDWAVWVLRTARVTTSQGLGRVTWVLGSVALLTILAYRLGLHLPTAQLLIHGAALIVGMTISRSIAGHIAAAFFVPMATIDFLELAGFIGESVWWWAIYYIALAQLVALIAGADLHPLGRALRRVGEAMARHMERALGWARWTA